MISRALLPLALLAANSPAQAPQASDVVIRSQAREVLLDVVVRDAHGKLVTNLKPEDVTVFEDGVRQDVRSFRLVAGSEVRLEDERQSAEAKAAPVNAPVPVVPPAINPLRTVNLVCLVLNDITENSPGDSLVNPTRQFAFEAARKFIDNQLRPNTFIGIFTLDATGLRPIYPFSNDRASLLKAAGLASRNQIPAVAIGNTDPLAALTGQAGVLGAVMGSIGTAEDARSGNDVLGSRAGMREAAVAGLRELDAMKGLIRQLAASPFHKTVLLLSPGLTRPPDQLEYWDSVIRAAVDGGVTFYSVDVHGLDANYDPTSNTQAMLKYSVSLSSQQGPTSQQGYTAAGDSAVTLGGLAAHTMEQAHQDDYVRFGVSSANPQEALRELAERTGGFIIANTNNVDHLLSRVMEEVDTHYEIAYPPKSDRDDGHFRKIEVKLTRPGLRVDTRNGYFAMPDNGRALTPAEMTGLRVLDTQPRPHAFNFLSRAYRFRDSGGQAQYAIAFEMPISNLTATAEAHRHRFHASLLALVKNADGVIVDRVSKDVPSEVPDDRLETVRHEFMTYQHAVNLPPARYTVETAVVDQEGNRASTGSFSIDNREQPGVGVSDLAVVRKLENLTAPADPTDPFEYTGKRVLPFVANDFPHGMRPFVFFMIYPEAGDRAQPVARVRLLRDGKTIATLRPEVTEPDSTGGIPMLLQLTDKPGSYEVRTTVTQGKSSTERTLQFTLAR
jgi:VWFA-related protein